MIATVDIGNTNIVVGIMDENMDLLCCVRMPSNRDKSKDDFIGELNHLLDTQNENADRIEGAIISSVVPELTAIVYEGMLEMTGVKPLVVGRAVETGIHIDTDHPDKVGADLIVDAVAATEQYEDDVIIFDLGTATTVSVVDKSRSYDGTMIIPGIGISLEALSNKASQLPHIPLEKPEHLIGKNTIESMQSGVLYGHAAMIDGLIDRICQEYGKKMTVIVTGGIASIVVPLCRHDVIYDPDLLLKGLWYIYQKNL